MDRALQPSNPDASRPTVAPELPEEMDVIPNLKLRLPPCSRCQGKMIMDKESGDSTCFTCGGIVYAVEPLNRETPRPISHAGQSLN